MATYKEFINDILINRGRHNCEGYFEKHHILPKCMGGDDNENNLIDLTGQEHFIAHQLLYIENPHNKDLAYAWHIMCCHKNTQNRYIPTPQEVGMARQAAADAWRGQHHTEETKQKIREKITGIKRNETTKQKLRERNLGKVMSEDIKSKISEAHHPQKYHNLNTNFTGSAREISKKYGCGIRTLPSAFERHPDKSIVKSIGYEWEKIKEEK